MTQKVTSLLDHLCENLKVPHTDSQGFPISVKQKNMEWEKVRWFEIPAYEVEAGSTIDGRLRNKELPLGAEPPLNHLRHH